ncbi:hypothetical protein, partial [Candidatus Avelusimicrobium stercoris]|uniref:hypothetical protein n=1 Tax=Candidatus Avelusimicrobium stercoris TaxID=1947924 RepID=UPI003D11B654
MATTQDVDSESPAGRQFRMPPIFITAFSPPSFRKVFIRDLLFVVAFWVVIHKGVVSFFFF